MADKHLSGKPHGTHPHFWWYEERAGLLMVVESRDNEGNYIRTECYKIPWSALRAALKRKDRK